MYLLPTCHDTLLTGGPVDVIGVLQMYTYLGVSLKNFLFWVSRIWQKLSYGIENDI